MKLHPGQRDERGVIVLGVADLVPEPPPFDGRHRIHASALWGRDAEVLCACGRVSFWFSGTLWECPAERARQLISKEGGK